MPSADQVPTNNSHSRMLWHMWVVLIAGSTGSALRAVRPPNLHITPVVRRDLGYRASATVEVLPRNCSDRCPAGAFPFPQSQFLCRADSVDDLVAVAIGQWRYHEMGSAYRRRATATPNRNAINSDPRGASRAMLLKMLNGMPGFRPASIASLTRLIVPF